MRLGVLVARRGSTWLDVARRGIPKKSNSPFQPETIRASLPQPCGHLAFRLFPDPVCFCNSRRHAPESGDSEIQSEIQSEILSGRLLRAEKMSKYHNVRLPILLVWLVSLPFITPWGAGADEPESLSFHDSYNAAIREAKQTKKPIFLAFRCAP